MAKPTKTAKTKSKLPTPAKARKATRSPEPVIARAILRESAPEPKPAKAPANPAKQPKTAKPAKPTSKLARLEAMLRADGGATIEALSKAIEWQAHSVRGAISGALKKKQGLTVESSKNDSGERTYRIVG